MVQLDEARKQLSARQKTRTREGARLRTALTNLEAQAAADAQQVLSAQQAHEELLQNLPSYLSPAVQARPHPPSSAPKGQVGPPTLATAVQAPALGALVPSHHPPSPAPRPHLKKTAPKLTPPHMAPKVTVPIVAPRQEVSGTVSQAALCTVPTSMASKASSSSAGETTAVQQAVWQPAVFPQQASGQTAPTRHAYLALEQSAQLACLPQGAYILPWLAAASASVSPTQAQGQAQAQAQGQPRGQPRGQAQAGKLQQKVSAPRDGSKPPLKRYKLSCPSEGAGCPSGSAAVATAAHVLMKKRGEALAAMNRHRSLASGAETPQEGLMMELTGSMTQQRGLTTQQMGSMTQQRGLPNQQMGSVSQQRFRLPQSWTGTATDVHAAQKPAAPSATLRPQVAAAHTHPDATIASSCTAQARLTQPHSAWAGTPVRAVQSRLAIPSRQTTSPPQVQARSLLSQQRPVPGLATLAPTCQPPAALTAAGSVGVMVPWVMTCAGPLSGVSAPQAAAAAPAALVMAAPVPVPAASCLRGPGTSLMEAAAAQQQAVVAPQQLVCTIPPGQASSTQAVTHEVKAGPQTLTHPYQLQDMVPTCPLSAATATASASCLTPVSAAHGPSLEVHPNVPNNGPGGPMLLSQQFSAQGWVAHSSAAQKAAAVSSAGGTAAATLGPGESRPKSMLAACVSPKLQAPALQGLPAELLALFNQTAACDSQALRSQLPHSKPSNALPNMHLPVQIAPWHNGGSHKFVKNQVTSQQQANLMLGMY